MGSALALLPDFLLILLGVLLRRSTHGAESFWTGIEKLVYFVLFPSLLFLALARAPLQLGTALPLVLAGALSLLVGLALGLAAGAVYRLPGLTFASQVQCAYRFNSYLGLAIAASLQGQAGVAGMGLLVGAMVPLANFAAVGLLAHHARRGFLREIVSNPLVLASAVGLAWNALALPLPLVAEKILTRLAEAAIALGLLAVGAALRLSDEHVLPAERGAAAWMLAVKLLGMPACAWVIGSWLGLANAHFEILLAFAALPTASSAYILAQRMGGNGRSVAWLISASTLGAMITLPLWVGALHASH